MSRQIPLFFIISWIVWGSLLAFTFRYGTGEWGVLFWLISGLVVAHQRHRYLRLQRTVSQLKQNQLIQSEFVALAMHEVNTPLAALCGRLDMLVCEDGANLTPDQHLKFRPVMAAVGRFSILLGDLRDSINYAGQWQLVVRQTDLRTILSDCWEEARPLFDNALPRRLLLPPDNLLINGDADRLGQIFRNLLSNAAKYAQGRPVDLTLTIKPRTYQIEIKDQGAGLAPDELAHLGERFFQSQSPNRQPGTGLGLYIVRQLVEAHGGTVRFHSAGLGQGLTVTIDLPRPAIGEKVL